MSETSLLRDAMAAFLATTVEGYDWEAHYEATGAESQADLFRATITTEPVRRSAKYYDCGSIAVEQRSATPVLNIFGNPPPRVIAASTPEALYRILYLVQPPHVDCSDMYKAGLLQFRSVDKRFLVNVSLFKYELGLYFCCQRDALGGRGSMVIAGAPGSDNGWNCTDPDGLAFFEMVVKAIGQQWQVYSGNDFIV